MIASKGKRKTHFKFTKPTDPAVKPIGEWLPENRRFYADFCSWLRQGGYSPSARNIYSVATRFALGYLNLPVERIQSNDIERVRVHLATSTLSPSTLAGYHKGLNKLAEYLEFPRPESNVNWDGYLKDFPPALAHAIHAYAAHCARSWSTDNYIQLARNLLSRLSTFSRSMHLTCVAEITPRIWFTYVEAQLKAGIKSTSLNAILQTLKSFLRFLQREEQPICERMLEVRPLKTGQPLPRDLPISQVKSLMQVDHSLMDRAWLLLMLHSGLRTCEVRNLRLSDIDLAQQSIRIRESKSQRERIVYLGLNTVETLQTYLADRTSPNEFLFTRYHKPLSKRYCQSRLKTIGKEVNIKATPHQLRHTCATLLLNAGMSIIALQSLLGHRYVETTLNYARLYDSVVVKQYLEATAEASNR